MKLFEELKILLEADENARDLRRDYEIAKRTGLTPPAKIQTAFLNKISLTSPYIYYIYRYRTHYIKSNDINTAGVLPSQGVVKFYYNEQFVNGLSDEELVFLMEHELEHVVRDHSQVFQRLKVFARVTEEQGGDSFSHEVFNLAADSRINADLLGIGHDGKQEKDGRLTHLSHKMISGGWVFNDGPKELVTRTAYEALSLLTEPHLRDDIPKDVTWENIEDSGIDPQLIEVARKLKQEKIQFYTTTIKETDETGVATGQVRTEKIQVSSLEGVFGTDKKSNKIKFEDAHGTDDYFMWAWENRENYKEFKKKEEEDGDGGGGGEDKDWVPQVGMPVDRHDGTFGKITAINPDGSIETVEITEAEAEALSSNKFATKKHISNINRPRDQWTITF